MSKEIVNPPAFPSEIHCQEGMDLRDYFAGQVMSVNQLGWDKKSIAEQARLSYEMADAMLKERSKN